MIRRLTLAALVAATPLLAACGDGITVTHGEVVKLEYVPENTWMQLQCMPSGNNACASQMQVWHTDPEDYRVTIENCDLKPEGADECPTDWYSVDPMTYSKLEVGDQFAPAR